jgi:IclR family transcriptional regulator, acetate operon repressor
LTGTVRRSSLSAMEQSPRPTLIASVRRALRLMEAVAAHPGGAPAKRLARQVDLPLATVYHLLRTLTHEGYLIRTEDGLYVLGDRVDTLESKRRAQGLVTRTRDVLTSLRDELGVATYFSLYQDDEIQVIDIADGPRTPRVDLWVEIPDSAHAHAIGKCVLAQLEPELRRDYLAEHPLVGLTPNTITEPAEFERRLASPLALDREEYILGTGCAAVPVTDATGAMIGAVAVSCRPGKLPKVQASARRIWAAAARITRVLTI